MTALGYLFTAVAGLLALGTAAVLLGVFIGVVWVAARRVIGR